MFMIISFFVDDFKAKLKSKEFVDYIKEITSEKYGIDVSKKPKAEPEYQASFRKLNVD